MKGVSNLLVANRGEIAVRVLRAAAELGIRSVAIHSEDDAESLHTRRADVTRALDGVGPAPYLDIDQILEVARTEGCDALHPGYGFLSENVELADRCAAAGIAFVGPPAESLRLFGSKVEARELAVRCGVPVLRGTPVLENADQARDFLASLGAGGSMMLKAEAGGGGRGIRVVTHADEVDEAFTRCGSEAEKSFGSNAVYAEERLAPARHVEIQIVADGKGSVRHLFERECSLQRRHQKLVEIAPAPGLSAVVREQLYEAAVAMARAAAYRNLGTFEFLVEARGGADARFAFLEANPRLQVEHTVTEAVTGIDLVQTQIGIAGGRTLDQLGLAPTELPSPRGYAIQTRINLESVRPDGSVRPARGILTAFEVPSGLGVRTDTFGTVGMKTSVRFDSLLAKLVAHSSSSDYADCVRRARRALREFRIEGVETNLPFLQALLSHDHVQANQVHTGFVEEHAAELARMEVPPSLFVAREAITSAVRPAPDETASASRAGARIDASDPLAVLDHGKQEVETRAGTDIETVAEGTVVIHAPLQGTITSIEAAVGALVPAGSALLVLEAMKMEHVIETAVTGRVQRIEVAVGDTVTEDAALVVLEATDVEVGVEASEEIVDLDGIRPDLAEVNARHAKGFDAARPEAVARRRKTGQRTARENVEDLCDEGTFVEYGSLVIAAQRRRRPVEELIERTPADGMLAGVGQVNGALFDDEAAQCIVMSYDYTVLAGTQGQQNHRKKDRMFELAERRGLPVIFLTEGGGGRPGDTDGVGVAGLDCLAFQYFGRLSGRVPLVGLNSGRCFAGNAALLGCCDVVIATRNSNIGMGGPAMIEGGGLGVFRPEEVGPIDVQVANGVVDVVVEDEAEGAAVARKYLSYFQGSLADWECADQRRLRSRIPENRLRIYDVRAVIEDLADTDSVLELRRGFGAGMVTALIRIAGRPLGVVANNPVHLAGAIDSDGADKAARFMQLCDAFDLPLLFLCDTPGIMVGPEAEKTALVRHASRMFVTGASLSVPFFTIVLRKGYGLGAQAMAGGSFKAPWFTVSWPTGEFGGMGLEGAVKLGFRGELAAVEDPVERKALFERMVDRMYEHGKAVNMASHFEIDDVIDPAASRDWILGALREVPEPVRPRVAKRPCIDTW